MADALIEILKSSGALDFSGILVLSTVFFVWAVIVPAPLTALCLGTGAVFGLSAVAVIMPRTTLGAIIAFLSSRYLFAERLYAMVDRSPKLRIALNATDAKGWRVVGLMRFAGPRTEFP